MKPGEHKTVQSRILAYAQAIGWTLVPREEAERRRGFDPDAPPKERAKNRSLFFDHLVKSIERKAQDESDDPYLIAMAEHARAVQESFEDRQTSSIWIGRSEIKSLCMNYFTSPFLTTVNYGKA